jgi:UDP-3-O-[3-hydroxymyristoyl] glucosamine N-acyltransferase
VSATLGQLAELVQGRLIGNADLVICAARPLTDAAPGDITFVEHEKHAPTLLKSKASAAVVPASLPVGALPVIQTDNPLVAFAAIVRHLHGRAETPIYGIDSRAVIHPSAQIGSQAIISPFVSVAEGSVIGARCRLHTGVVVGRFCRLGDDVTIYPNVVLYDGTILGNRVIIHANAVIGADGFGYRFHDNRHVKVPQLGHVEIGDNVEIGACSTIDRGTFQPTRIGEGTKIDNLVQVGHNCRVGRHNLIVSQTGIAGSCTTGDYVVMAGQVGIADHIDIGEQAVIGAQAGVMRDVPAGTRAVGYPAAPERETKRIWALLTRLPEMRKDLLRVKQHLGLNDEQVNDKNRA